MAKIILFYSLLLVQLSTQFWFFKKAKDGFLDEISVKLPDSLGSEKLPITEQEAERNGWRKTDHQKCDGNKVYRGNRYRYEDEYGTMLLFDSNGRIAGMQAAVPTTVEMTEQRRYMMPVVNGRYHLTVYFKDPKKICSSPTGRERDSEKRFLIQNGGSWRSVMNVAVSEAELNFTVWVKGGFVPFMGTFYWYAVSKEMDCERTFPIYLTYSNGKLYSFGWTFKGYFNDPKFSHPSPSLARFAFDVKTFPECIKNAKKKGSTAHIYLRS